MVNTAPGRSHSTPQRQCGHLSRILLYPDWPARTGRYSQALPVDSDLSRRDAIPDDASSPGALSKNTNVVARPKYSCVRTGRQRAGRYSQALSINTDISRRHAFPYYAFSPGALANDAGSRAITVAFQTSHITYAIDTGARARRRQCGGKLAFARLALPIYADLVTPRDARLAGAKRSLTITTLHDRLEPAEPHRDQLPNTGLSIRPFVDHREPLCLVRAQRQNDPSSGFDLIEDRRRQSLGGGRLVYPAQH